MIQEIETRLDQIAEDIETEQKVLDTMAGYKDCDMKTAVVHQCKGVIRGLRTAKHHLEQLLDTLTREPQHTLFDDPDSIDGPIAATRG